MAGQSFRTESETTPSTELPPVTSTGSTGRGNAARVDALGLSGGSADAGVPDVDGWMAEGLLAQAQLTASDLATGISAIGADLVAGRYAEGERAAAALLTRAEGGISGGTEAGNQVLLARLQGARRITEKLAAFEKAMADAKGAMALPGEVKAGSKEDKDDEADRIRAAAAHFKTAADLGDSALAAVRFAGTQGILSAAGAKSVEDRLKKEVERARSMRGLATPTLHQHTGGGTNPGSYCGMTSLRMVLRMEGLDDPGADKIATGEMKSRDGKTNLGASYVGGEADGPALGKRAHALGLDGAAFNATGNVASILTSLDGGRPVMAAGEGSFKGSYVKSGKSRPTGQDLDVKRGETWDHSYGGHYMVISHYDWRPLNKDEKVKDDQVGHRDGLVTSFTVDDPDTGTRMKMTVDAFRDFFGEDGTIYVITYSGASAKVLEDQKKKREEEAARRQGGGAGGRPGAPAGGPPSGRGRPEVRV